MTSQSDAAGGNLSRMKKAAILLVSLGMEASAKVLSHLDPELVEHITREIANLDAVHPSVSSKVIEEFYNLALAARHAEQGGVNYARSILYKALDGAEADRILRILEGEVYKQPFAFLHRTDGENLLMYIQDEHPQTIALILAHLASSKASSILTGLPAAKQVEVISRIANMDQTNPDVIKDVERGLELRLSGLVSQSLRTAGGVESVAEMLNLADRSTEKGILEALEGEDPDLVERIRRLMFVFEDIMLVNDKGIQSVLKEVENDELSLSLKTATPELRDKIFKNMSDRAAQLIKEDMEFMGPVRITDVEAAQQKIVDVVRRLEESGEIIISGRGGEKEMIV
ncbi:MAG: flagellar motor switch protein FliG [Phycisphaerae bacterium]